ncbi:MAG: hypothetical protein NC037_01075 [Bacteroides sp.]|nr:hypothetical protein [Bacillota bacterium]MCM1393515.1 hypothetical protein [[Eubacterium] siraeum]MCM1455108.1 hypothetical protein [Bacteroides sp.]
MSKRKNVSSTIPNGTLVHTHDNLLAGADGKSTKRRMATVVDSNRNNQIAIVKYTTSDKNGTEFDNDKGFVAHGNQIYTQDVNGNPLVINDKNHVIKKARNTKRDITPAQANEIKRANLQESRYRQRNQIVLRKLKGRKK